MAEKPLAAVRKKPQSSLVVGLPATAAGQVGRVSLGGQHRCRARRSTMILGLHPASSGRPSRRPFPPRRERSSSARRRRQRRLLCSRAGQLCYLGTVYMQDVHGRPNPRVGLLNVARRTRRETRSPRKPTSCSRTASGLNYIGNVEGRDILGHISTGRLT
jgi:glycerol-3-phosphate acyltransferase PlsX